MSERDEIVSVIKSMLKIAENDFEKNNAPNGENDLREHFFAGQISAFRKCLKYIGDRDWQKNDAISPSSSTLEEMQNPSYRRLCDYPLLVELFNRTSKN